MNDKEQHPPPLPAGSANEPAQPLRRHFLIQGALGMTAAATFRPKISSAATTPQWAMVIDLNRCTGCQSCVIACKAHNDTVENQFNTRIVISESSGEEKPLALFTPVQCNQCDPPPCVAACDKNATFKLASGIVVTDWAKCSGDQSCVAACPYGARHVDPRYGNKADKCDFCLHLLEKDLLPACVVACPSGARLFGDAHGPEGELAAVLRRSHLVGPQPQQGLKTSVYYVSRRKNSGKGGAL